MNRFARFSLVPALLALGAAAQAAVPPEVTTAVGDMKTDASEVAVAVLVGIIVVAAIKFIRRGI
jgi:hypothetical protein